MSAALAAMLAAPAAAKQTREEKAIAMVSRPVAELEPLVKVTGDALDPRITVSSSGVSQEVSKGLLASTTNENSFLRAYIDKATGKVSAQIYYIATYGGRGWHFLRTATYEAPGGIKEVEVVKVGSDVNCYRYGCTHYEEVVIPIDFAILEAAASNFDPANPLTAIKFRVFGQSGMKFDDAVPGNEIAAFVNVVRRSTPNPTPAK